MADAQLHGPTGKAHWQTHTSVTYRPPAARTVSTDLNIYVDKKVGKRTAMQIESMMKEAMKEPAEEKATMDFTTTSRTAHKEVSLEGVAVGARVMKTQDGVPIGLEQRDRTFLNESNILPDWVGKGPKAENLPSEPFTIHHQSVQLGSRVFPMSDQLGANPFAKSTNFSKPLDDCTKVSEE